MANRKEVLEKLKAAASGGNIREAYREFEELPIVDQLAISITPGIGDALAVYEIGEFGARGAKRLEEKKFLGAAGYFGLSALAGASLIPLFRLFRGAKAVKAIPKTEIKLLEDLTPGKTLEETIKDVPVPKVEEFKPLSLDDQMYPGTTILFKGLMDQRVKGGLTSKAAKFINTNKKLLNEGKAISYINALEKSGVPKGELRLLNLINEAGEIHPKLMSELEIRNPQGKIARQRLANYIKSNQGGALGRRALNKNNRIAVDKITQTNSRAVNADDVTEATYHVRDLDRKENFAHYSGDIDHKNNFVFDSVADYTLPSLEELRPIREFIGGDNLLNVSRIQSDYAEELGRLQQKNVADNLDHIRNKMAYQNLPNEKFQASYMLDIVRQNPGLKTGKELKQKYFEALENKNSQIYKKIERATGEDASIVAASLLKNKRAYKADDFESLIPAIEEARLLFPVTPYVDPKAVAAVKKSLTEYNQNVPKINKLAQDKFKIQNELKASGLTPDSPSYLKVVDELDAIDEQLIKLSPSLKVMDQFDGYTLSKTDLEEVTGKPFIESLDKTLDEIFYDFEYLRGGDSGPITQTYGPGTPGERALKYFNEMVLSSDKTFDLNNGLSILKKATKIDASKFKGYSIDPYAKGTRTEATKLPIRFNFLKAVSSGKDGMYLDSGSKRLISEGGEDADILRTTYKEAENEINKIIKELGENPKDYVKTNKTPQNIIDQEELGQDHFTYEGTYVKINDKIRALVKEKGIDAFKDGGPVSIENMLAAL